MSMTKGELRRALRAASPGTEARDRESRLLCAHVTAWEPYRRARVVGGYVPLPWEADVTPLLQDALDRNKTLALPRCLPGGQLCFHRVESLQALRRGAYGLLEPRADAPVVDAGEIALLLVPLEGVRGAPGQGRRLLRQAAGLMPGADAGGRPVLAVDGGSPAGGMGQAPAGLRLGGGHPPVLPMKFRA